MSGTSARPVHLDRILEQIKQVPLQVFPILYPASGHSDLMSLAEYGKAYSIPEGEEQPGSGVTPLNYLAEVLLDVLHLAEGLRIQKVRYVLRLQYFFTKTNLWQTFVLSKKVPNDR